MFRGRKYIFGSCSSALPTSIILPACDLEVSGGHRPKRQRCENAAETLGGLHEQRGTQGAEESNCPPPRGCWEDRRRSRAGNKRWQPTQQMLASCCAEAARLWVRCACGAHPEGGAGGGTCLGSPVILHNAGQIRLELTAEDIQLDCACHSVASIRVSPRAFVFAIATRENAARSCLFVSLPFMLTSNSGLLHYFFHWT